MSHAGLLRILKDIGKVLMKGFCVEVTMGINEGRHTESPVNNARKNTYIERLPGNGLEAERLEVVCFLTGQPECPKSSPLNSGGKPDMIRSVAYSDNDPSIQLL